MKVLPKHYIVLASFLLFFLVSTSFSFGDTFLYENYDSGYTGMWNASVTTEGHMILQTNYYYSSPYSMEYTSGVLNGYYPFLRLNKSYVSTDKQHIITTHFIYFNTTSQYITFGLAKGTDAWTSIFYWYLKPGTSVNSVCYKNDAGTDICPANTYTVYINRWYNFTFDYLYSNTGSLISIWINGTKLVDSANAFTPTSITYDGLIDVSGSDASWLNLDNTCIYNDTCIISSSSPDVTPPKVTFKEQIPITLDSNVFGSSSNITYNITDDVDIKPNSPYLNYSLNNSGSYINGYLNGTSINGFIQTNSTSNLTSNYSFKLFDNDLFFALYNFNETLMEQTQKQFFDCNSTTCLYFGEFYNFSNSNPYNILELNVVNNGTNPQPLILGVCNEKSSTPLTSSNCTQIFNNANIPINHSHQNGKSNHSTISFTFDSVSNKINGVWINRTIYPFVLTQNLPPKRWEIAYINNFSRSNAYTYWNGTGFQDLRISFDMHIHQNSTIFNYQACAYDTSNNFNCSEMRKVSLNPYTNLPPDNPFFTNPNSTNTTVYNPPNNMTYISWIIGLSPSGIPMKNCSIDLINHTDDTFIKEVNHSLALNTTYNWFTRINYTDVGLNITCCDNNVLCSRALSNNFSLYYYDLPVVIPPVSNITTNTTVNVYFNTSAIDNLANQTKYNVDILLIIVFLVLAIFLLVLGIFFNT